VQCPRCQAQNREEARFCRECGATFSSVCPSCGAKVEPGSRFCDGCGAPLAAASQPATRPSHLASPESYTPKHLAEKILTSKAALEGERKQVTVLFADLKGSMELLVDRDPEEARKLLDPVLERMMQAVHRYEGTVNQVMGDGIMALFGAPLAHEDHAVRACYAALRMQESVAQYAEGVFRSQGAPIKIRVGLNSGEVVVRAIGSDLHMDYTAVGQTTHLAARMEQLATPGSTRLTAATLRLAEGHVEVKPLGATQVKGLPEPVEVYELVGAASVRSRLHVSIARGLTRFTGRDNELDQLRQALESAGAGHGQVVAVVGEPGVGKSRLLWEFAHSHRTEGWLILETRSVSYGKAASYVPVIELLRAYFHIEARDDARKIREKVTGKLLSLDRALEPCVPPLLWLLDVPVEDPAWERLEPPQRRQRTLAAVKHLLLRESQAQPLVVIFEDLHWIDAETQALLESLIESLPTARLLLLVNYRPEYRHEWGSKTYYRQLRIDPLPPASAEALLRALLGEDATLQAFSRLLVERTEGNPLFLEESVRMLVEIQVLTGERGAYLLARPAEKIQVPATVQAILASRIDRLSPEDKHLLEAASVIGKDVPFSLLEAIASLAEDELRRGLTRLQAAEFLYESRLFPDLEYTFKHALTHELAYKTLLQERRMALHARIVDAIEMLDAERRVEQCERLAYHAFQAELWQKATMYLRQAADRAIGRSALREAVSYMEQTLVALSHLGDSREAHRQALDVRLSLRTVLFQLGQHASAIENLQEAVELATTLDDRPRLARACAFLVTEYVFAGDYDRALDFGRRVVALGEATADPLLVLEMDYRFAQIYYGTGDYRRGLAMLRRSLNSIPAAAARARSAFNASVFWRVYLGLCLAELGEFDEGRRFLEEAVPLAEASELAFDMAGLSWGVGLLHNRRGDVPEALPILERGSDLCEAKGLHVVAPIIRSLLGLARCRSGALTEGTRLLEESARDGQSIFPFSSQVSANLAEGRLLGARPREAVAAAEQALTVARNHGERGHEAWVLRLLGDVWADMDATCIEPAERYYREALAIGLELGMRPVVAHCHAGLAKLYSRFGNGHQMQEHLAIATTMYREMGMTYWLEKAEQETKNLG
jgi:class 3 adenylate cyclase/tetratricopeptide (TPR) repeat protein